MSHDILHHGEEHLCKDECEGCPYGGPKVGTWGNPKADVVFVVPGPNFDALRAKQPLAGAAWKIFNENVSDNGNVYIVNAMECFSGKKKDDKLDDKAVHCCSSGVYEKIRAHPRKIIIAMGNPALRSVTNDMGLKITQCRGSLIASELAEHGIMPIVHVAAIAQGTGSYRQWKEDVVYALHLASGASPKTFIKTWYAVIDRITEDDPESKDRAETQIGLALDDLLKGNLWTADTETSSLHALDGYILNFGITNGIIRKRKMRTWVFHEEHLPYLKKYFEDEAISWCWHNGKFDIRWFHEKGVNARTDDDTMLMSYTLDESPGVHGLETLMIELLGAPDYKYMVKPYLKSKKTSYAEIPDVVLDEYVSIDTGGTAQIRPILRERVRKVPALEKLYTKTLLPASKMLTQVEKNGFHIDPDRLDENDVYFAEVLKVSNAKINEMYGKPINPGSPKQVKEMLFSHYKFPNRKKGSTDKDVIANLIKVTDGHPILIALLEHRAAVKMLGTYVKGIRRWIYNDGRVHPTFKLHGTKTGRLAASEPNTQNPPRLPQIRGTFVAREGYELIECDLSQAELRTLAILSKDPILCQVYLNGEDLHTDLACSLFPGWMERSESTDPIEKILAKEQRVKCKNVNFGIIYGITEFGLFEQIGGSIAECRKLIKGWYARYKVAGEYIARCRSCPKLNMIMTTPFGRKKRVGIVSRKNLIFLENEAANFPPQSIASDITLHAGIQTWEELMEMEGKVRIVNLVHDAIITESLITPGNVIRKQVIGLVTGALESVPLDWGLDDVPYVADAEIGHRWGSLVPEKKLGEEVLTS